MKFDELDSKMRNYEQSLDAVVPSDVYMIARLDGKSFTRLTKELCDFEAPFDVRFRDMMIKTASALMDCGFKVVYAYTTSDEISLLFHKNDATFARKLRKLNSTLAGVASAAFSLELGRLAVLDCRIVPLPNIDSVKDYFSWRQQDGNRNALNGYCYWTMRKNGNSVGASTDAICSKTADEKIALLHTYGVDFANVPAWQKYGVGIWWWDVEKTGYNPKTKENVTAVRHSLHVSCELPHGRDYGDFIEKLCTEME